MDAPVVDTSLTRYVVLVVAGVSLLAFVASLIFVCWWTVCRQTALHADSKANCPGIYHVLLRTLLIITIMVILIIATTRNPKVIWEEACRWNVVRRIPRSAYTLHCSAPFPSKICLSPWEKLGPN